MDDPWIIHGLSIDYPWMIHGLSMDHPWIIYRLSGGSLPKGPFSYLSSFLDKALFSYCNIFSISSFWCREICNWWDSDLPRPHKYQDQFACGCAKTGRRRQTNVIFYVFKAPTQLSEWWNSQISPWIILFTVNSTRQPTFSVKLEPLYSDSTSLGTHSPCKSRFPNSGWLH